MELVIKRKYCTGSGSLQERIAAAFRPAALEDSTRERDPSDPLNIIGVGTETPGRTERGGSEVGVDLIGRAWNMYAETTP